MKWGPAKPRVPIKVVECGPGLWDDHGLDIPHEIETTDFRVTGRGHERIEGVFHECCTDRSPLGSADSKQLEIRIPSGFAGTLARSFYSTRRLDRP